MVVLVARCAWYEVLAAVSEHQVVPGVPESSEQQKRVAGLSVWCVLGGISSRRRLAPPLTAVNRDMNTL